MKQKISLFLMFLVTFFIPSAVLAVVPNDPHYFEQWYLPAINAPAAWDKTIGSRQIIVAVLDTGVEVAHPDLQDNIWHNPEEIPFNNFDDDANGFVDDVYGWDFVGNQANPGPDLLLWSTPQGLHHGTIVAGLIGAIGNNGTAGVGVNWQVSIMPLRVLDNDGSGDSEAVARAIDYAVQEHALVINMSFVGVDPGEELHQSVLRAMQAGVVIVAAGGNDAGKSLGGDLNINKQYPVCYNGSDEEKWGVIGVAALKQNDTKASFSDYGGQCIDIAAPGVNIASTLVFHSNQPELANNFGGNWSGTSLATPLVTGAVALLKSLRPSLTPKEIYEILTKSTDSLTDKDLIFANQLGAGKLNLSKAMALFEDMYPQIPIQKLPTQQILAYSKIGSRNTFYDVNGEVREYSGAVKVYSRKDLPRRVVLFYNKYKGKLTITRGDIDGDWEKEFITVKPGINPMAIVWSENGVKKSELRIKGDYRKGIGLVVY